MQLLHGAHIRLLAIDNALQHAQHAPHGRLICNNNLTSIVI